jgi:hypothetical protein
VFKASFHGLQQGGGVHFDPSRVRRGRGTLQINLVGCFGLQRVRAIEDDTGGRGALVDGGDVGREAARRRAKVEERR